MNLLKKLKEIEWESGSAEILAFCCMLPFVLVIILIFCDIALFLKAGQLAEYCTYIGGRAAAICVQDASLDKDSRLKMAESAANSVVSATMGAENYLFSEYERFFS